MEERAEWLKLWLFAELGADFRVSTVRPKQWRSQPPSESASPPTTEGARWKLPMVVHGASFKRLPTTTSSE